MYCICEMLLFCLLNVASCLLQAGILGSVTMHPCSTGALVQADKLAIAGSTMWSEHLDPDDAFSTYTAC